MQQSSGLGPVEESQSESPLNAVPLVSARPNATADSALINRAKLGDIEAFTAIVERYHPRAVRFARGLLRNQQDAEDVVQEAFLRVYRALPRYEERQRFDAWLFRILGNCCRSANASQHRRDVVDVNDEVALERVAAPDTTDRSFELEFGDEVRRALAEVPEYNREIFLLHHIEGFSYDEIEKMTGVRQSALKMRVKRAADHLRAKLAGVFRG